MKKSEKSPRRRAPAPVPLRLALACAWLAGAWPVAAQTLGEVMVSASRHEQPVDELPVSADVIGAGRMEREQMGDIHDVARDLPLRFSVFDDDATTRELIGVADLDAARVPSATGEFTLPLRSEGAVPRQTGTLRLRAEVLP